MGRSKLRTCTRVGLTSMFSHPEERTKQRVLSEKLLYCTLSVDWRANILWHVHKIFYYLFLTASYSDNTHFLCVYNINIQLLRLCDAFLEEHRQSAELPLAYIWIASSAADSVGIKWPRWLIFQFYIQIYDLHIFLMQSMPSAMGLIGKRKRRCTSIFVFWVSRCISIKSWQVDRDMHV